MLEQNDRIVTFNRGIPPAAAIPNAALASIAGDLAASRPELFQYAPLGGFRGDEGLRRALAHRHGAAQADEVFVGNGSLQVLDLVAAELLAAGGGPVLVETPTYDRAISIFERHGGHVAGVPVDRDGLDLQIFESRLQRLRPAFLYTIPDFQNPSGATLSLARRAAVLDLAAHYGVTIVEDIPYRDLRYRGAGPPGLGTAGSGVRVITVGSLSKTLSPGLRIGYAIAEEPMTLALARRAEATYLSPAPLCQAIAAESLTRGLVAETLAHLRTIFGPRCDAAVAAARHWLPGKLIAEPEGGYFLGLQLSGRVQETCLVAEAREVGVALASGSAFLPPRERTGRAKFLRLPFHDLEPSVFASGVERLAMVIDRLGA